MTQHMTVRRKLYVAGCCLCCAAAIAVECLTVKMFIDALSVKSWPTAEGTVTRSELESSGHYYTAHVEYEFAVNGREYRSFSVRTRGTSTKYGSDAKAVVDRFPAGAACTVYFKAGSPEVSYLEAGVGIVNYVIVISPIVFAFLFGVAARELLKPQPVQEQG